MGVFLSHQISSLESLIQDIDRVTGMAKCRDIVSRLEFLHDEQVNYDLNNKQQHFFIDDIIC